MDRFLLKIIKIKEWVFISKPKYLNRIGIVALNTYGSKMIIEEYIDANNIWVRFLENNYRTKTQWKHFLNGNVRNVYDKTVYGIGFLGEGIYKVKVNGKPTKKYNTWKDMIDRCCSVNLREKYLSYKDCSVAKEWYNFQTFAKWYDENYYEIDGQRMDLDKDILVKGNRVYSPETCVFVPQNINTLFTKRIKKRGKYPIGVNLHKTTKKYIAKCCNGNGKLIHIGLYNTPEEAFQAYKIFKEKVIKNIADEYKEKIPTKLYNAMTVYKIGIDD